MFFETSQTSAEDIFCENSSFFTSDPINIWLKIHETLLLLLPLLTKKLSCIAYLLKGANVVVNDPIKIKAITWSYMAFLTTKLLWIVHTKQCGGFPGWS